MIAIIDYGVGNLFSLSSSFKAIGYDTIVTGDVSSIKKADKLILPGVGAFENAIKKLKDSGIDEVIYDETSSGKPLMGICLGMQLLFERSFEYGVHNGLGLIKGEVISMENTLPKELKIPHIGWNYLKIKKKNPIFKYISEGDYVYFVHSFYVTADNNSVIATTEYGKEFAAAVAKDNIYGCQFHPEKSGDVGLKILKAFCEME
jgi:glutamine amidotransferase